ncbi:MAG: hypothetical protein ABSG53_24335 [Thermoguttaceae bacterium]|jgi:hypothetical protein
MTNWLFRSLRDQRRRRAALTRAADARSRKPRFECLEDRRPLTAVQH